MWVVVLALAAALMAIGLAAWDWWEKRRHG
jgi:hypothetical protein